MNAWGWSVVGAVVLWRAALFGYLGVMKCKDMAQAGTYSRFWKIHTYDIALFVGLLDVLFQWSFGNMFLERPPTKRVSFEWLGRDWSIVAPEMLFSNRVQRHVDDSNGWRLRLAIFWGGVLNGPDGNHIRNIERARLRLQEQR